MTRYGGQFGPDITFLGVPAVDLDDADELAGADVVVVGAPFDGGTSHRPGTRFGPQAIPWDEFAFPSTAAALRELLTKAPR